VQLECLSSTLPKHLSVGRWWWVDCIIIPLTKNQAHLYPDQNPSTYSQLQPRKLWQSCLYYNSTKCQKSLTSFGLFEILHRNRSLLSCCYICCIIQMQTNDFFYSNFFDQFLHNDSAALIDNLVLCLPTKLVCIRVCWVKMTLTSSESALNLNHNNALKLWKCLRSANVPPFREVRDLCVPIKAATVAHKIWMFLPLIEASFCFLSPDADAKNQGRIQGAIAPPKTY